MAACGWLVGFLGWIGVLLYHRASKSVFLMGLTMYLTVASLSIHGLSWQINLLWGIYGSLVILLGFPLIRRHTVTRYFFQRMKKTPSLKPSIHYQSRTEHSGWISELVKGATNWAQLLQEPMPQLSGQEILFLSGPVEHLIQQIDPWDITHNRHDLPTKVWHYLKREGFFGLLIPTQYGGHGFSYYGVLNILQKIAGVSDVIAHIIGLANSLNPSQLILTHGSETQRQYHLTRFAKGESIACLGLMDPETDTGMAAISDQAVITYGSFRGEHVLGFQITWKKRLIPLAPIANEIAVLVHVRDPQRLFSEEIEGGLSWILIPTHLTGIQIGRRHAPLDGVMTMGPCIGQDVFVPLDYRIGESDGLGAYMMESMIRLYQGITLPATQLGRSKAIAAYLSAYARITYYRHEPLSKAPGISEKLMSITGTSYLMDAITRFSVSELYQDPKCTLIPSITKIQTTELSRQLIQDAMEIQGHKAFCLGPKNRIAQAYQRLIDEVNMGERNSIIRSHSITEQTIAYHPHYIAKQNALAESQPSLGLKQMDRHYLASWGHLASHHVRAWFLSLTHGRCHWHTPDYCQPHFQALARLSSAYALLLDVCLRLFQSTLSHQRISGRLADCLSGLYVLSALLRNFSDTGKPKEELPIMDYLCQRLACHVEYNILIILDNLPSVCWRNWLRFIIFPFGLIYKSTEDNYAEELSEWITVPNEARDRLFAGLDFERLPNHPVSAIHQTWQQLIAVQPLLERMYEGLVVAKELSGTFESDLRTAVDLGIITNAEADILLTMETERRQLTSVEDFSAAELLIQQRSIVK